MKYKTILFDLDGTVTDPKVGITKSVRYALEKNNMEVHSLEALEKFIGPPLKDSFMKYYDVDEATAMHLINDYREYFTDKGIFENKLYDGMIDLLKALKDKDYTVAIATSKPTVFARRIIGHFGLVNYFDEVIGSNLDGTRINKAEVITSVMEQLNITNTNQTIMIGDREYDIRGAHENKIDSIGVAYGYGTIDELRQSNPTIIVYSIRELYDQLIVG
ncbi:phosphoglycolate phosphatase [Natranaerovirga hydrolytica]|uniref:Phosphoglycolate phosphatase n=1 Tax=Natranaerovirga hydrolytica TaxID=680378 RepID=A0A4R1N1B5_9FIRM|nr:HAD hydrolase-like protein [Natranaerovirga hydrolytica]TCK98740.1 phosphoglycolate phosphatase [Natranaerovirga hydrolytica]